MCLAIPGRIVEIFDVAGLKMGKVDFSGVIREACLEYIPDVVVGDYTVVHVGFAISRIDEAEAQRTLELLTEAGLFEDQGDFRNLTNDKDLDQ